MFNFVKKMFVRPVTQADIASLEIMGDGLSALEAIKAKMTTDEGRAHVDKHIRKARGMFVNQLYSMVRRGYVHNQMKGI